MNLSHVVHEFSFGPFFPAIAQPLDQSYEITLQRTSIPPPPTPHPTPRRTHCKKLKKHFAFSIHDFPILSPCRAYHLYRRQPPKTDHLSIRRDGLLSIIRAWERCTRLVLQV